MAGRLILNLGTSRLAWRGPDGGGAFRFRHEGEPGRRLLAALGERPAPGEVVLGSVAPREATDELAAACNAVWGLEPRRLVAAREAGGVRNGYRRPETLGIDRWAAVVAAYRAWGGAVLVADCGTAVTVDYVDASGRHAGGLIAPGRELMRWALVEGTRLRLADAAAPAPELFGTDTESAVAGGVQESIAGLLESVLRRVTAARGAPRRLILTGGGGPDLADRLGTAWETAPELVLDGLELLAEEAP